MRWMMICATCLLDGSRLWMIGNLTWSVSQSALTSDNETMPSLNSVPNGLNFPESPLIPAMPVVECLEHGMAAILSIELRRWPQSRVTERNKMFLWNRWARWHALIGEPSKKTCLGWFVPAGSELRDSPEGMTYQHIVPLCCDFFNPSNQANLNFRKRLQAYGITKAPSSDARLFDVTKHWPAR